MVYVTVEYVCTYVMDGPTVAMNNDGTTAWRCDAGLVYTYIYVVLGKGTAAGFKVRVVLKRRLDLGITVWDHRT